MAFPRSSQPAVCLVCTQFASGAMRLARTVSAGSRSQWRGAWHRADRTRGLAAKRRLLGPFQNDYGCPSAGRRRRIDVLHLVSSDSDEAFLIGIVPDRKAAADDVHGYRMVCFVDPVGAKGSDRTPPRLLYSPWALDCHGGQTW